MLEESIAEKMLRKLTGITDYNINIMNEKGIIIASQDISRIGTFHEVAYNIICQQQDLIEVSSDDHYLGTRNGVNLPVVSHSTIVGVIGITGNPDQVKPLALMLKMTIEVMLEFELQEREANARRSMKENFFNHLLYQSAPNEQDLCQQATRLGYHSSAIRIPILISFPSDTDETESNTIADLCKNRDIHTKQDMLIRIDNGDILIFLDLGKHTEICNSFKSSVLGYLYDIIEATQKMCISCSFYIGSIQNSLDLYGESYKHCLWLKRYYPTATEVIFFYDYVFDYLKAQIPMTELYSVFSGYVGCVDQNFWQSYATIMRAMEETNNNMVQCSKCLHMHKNTLIYQYNKIRQQLGINPMSSARDNQFALWLRGYLDQST